MPPKEGTVECLKSDSRAQRPLIVAVDDDPETLRALERLLRREPYEFLTTERPGDVLRWICERPVDLILADQRMPDMNGTDLLEVVRDYSPDTACVILSGYPETALIVERSGLRIERLIAKPWDNAELAAVIRRLLDERARVRSRDGGGRPEAPSSDAPRPAPEEVLVRCAGRSAREVIAEILPICSRGQTEGIRPSIVLADVRLLGDSLSKLLKGLARAVAWSHFPIDLRDESGCVAAFLSALGRGTPARK